MITAAPAAGRAGAAAERRWLPAAVAVAAGLACTGLGAVVAFLLIGIASGGLGWGRLLTGSPWHGAGGQFAAAAMIWGTVSVTAVAALVAAPVGWATAITVHELVPARTRRVLRAAVEALAVVPSIVYGLLGILYVRPLVAGVAGVPGGDSLAAAAVVLALMILPTVVSISLDALAGVPDTAREAARACGLQPVEVVRAGVLPLARRGFVAAVVLAVARALGETVAVFLLVGRADRRLPASPGDALASLVDPGQTLTTKLNGPEPLLAGGEGPAWAALCALGLVLLAMVAAVGLAGHRLARSPGAERRGPRRLVPASRWRAGRERLARIGLAANLAMVLVLLAAMVVALAVRGRLAFDPRFWWTPAEGASGGGIRNQVLGTLWLVGAAGLLVAPVGLGLGVAITEYAGRASGALRTIVLTLGGVPSILLGLFGYWLFALQFGWGKSWLAGAVVLALVALPTVAVAVVAAAEAVPPPTREAAYAVGLTHDQVVRSVVVRHSLPGLVTGLLLGLARAAGETAPILFTATVFSGAELPTGVRNAPVPALPTHIFSLAQDAVGPAALRTAWGSAFALCLVVGALALVSLPVRRRMDRWT